jgi:hypothetical protein
MQRFLQKMIDHQATTVAKLINRPQQHAPRFVRVCVQLCHPQRSLRSNGLVHLWDRLDAALRDTVTRIRGLPRPINHLDAMLTSLPIKMGGLGILSYKTLAPHAYAAASEAADTVLPPNLTPNALSDSTAPNLPPNINAAERSSRGTRRHCWVC